MADQNASTSDLTIDEKLDRILTDLADVKTRLGALASTAESRTIQTRPKLGQIAGEGRREGKGVNQ